MTPEQKARQKIDQQLEQCGWIVQNQNEMNISAGLGVAMDSMQGLQSHF
jgi:type I restriction enzyme R subunit